VVKGKNGLQAIQVTMAVYEIPAKRSREKGAGIFTAENAESAEKKLEFTFFIRFADSDSPLRGSDVFSEPSDSTASS
jgi:hypothetical protein